MKIKYLINKMAIKIEKLIAYLRKIHLHIKAKIQ